MSQVPNDNPYAHDPYTGDDLPAEPDRTSALAILSLVCGVLCCIPVLPTIGALLGLGALVGIKSSNGRVGGLGLAIAGLILGGLGTVAQLGIGLGVRQGFAAFVNDVIPEVDAAMQEIEAGQHDLAAARFDAPIAPGITPERLDAFRDAYTAELGAYQSMPTDFGSMISAYQSVAPAFEVYSNAGGAGGQTEFPLPASFANEAALLIIRMPRNPGGSPSGGSFPISNIIIITNGGSRIVLHDPVTSPTVPTTPDAPADAPTDAPGESPAGDEPTQGEGP
ncbi:MAG: DUF4190 domain-containing protein [Planctomycetota bacterium]